MLNQFEFGDNFNQGVYTQNEIKVPDKNVQMLVSLSPARQGSKSLRGHQIRSLTDNYRPLHFRVNEQAFTKTRSLYG